MFTNVGFASNKVIYHDHNKPGYTSVTYEKKKAAALNIYQNTALREIAQKCLPFTDTNTNWRKEDTAHNLTT